MKNDNRSSRFMLGYGLKYGRLTHISEVESGLDCACICPHCHQKLIARKGEINEHHFAHYDTESCEGAYESTMHLLGKEIIVRNKNVTLPLLEVCVSMEDISGRIHSKTHLAHGETINFDQVFPEAAQQEFIPDITAIKDGKQLFIEIVVTHDIDENKLDKVKAVGTNMMSIDLSNICPLLALDELEQLVLHDAQRVWVHEETRENILAQLEEELKREIDEINNYIKTRVLQGLSPHDIDQLKPQRTTTLKPDGQEHILLGYKSATGYSSKNQSHFDFSTLYMASRIISGKSSANYEERAAAGYEQINMAFREELLPYLENLQYPTLVTIDCEPFMLAGGRMGLRVKAVTPVA